MSIQTIDFQPQNLNFKLFAPEPESENSIDLGKLTSMFALFNTNSSSDNVSTISSNYSTDSEDEKITNSEADTDSDIDYDENLEAYSIEPQVNESKKILLNASNLVTLMNDKITKK